MSSFQSLYHKNNIDETIGGETDTASSSSSSSSLWTGDYPFLLLVALWLSRHLLIRWAVTWDPSDSVRPTLWGVCSNWITSHILAGQYFDRPSPDIVAKQMGTQHYQGSNLLLDNGSRGQTTTANNKTMTMRAVLGDLMWPSLIYTFRYVKAMVLYPSLELYERFFPRQQRPASRRRSANSAGGTPSLAPNTPKSNSQQSLSSSHRKHKRRNSGSNAAGNPLPAVAASRTPIYYLSSVCRILKVHGPSLQMIIPVTTFAFFIYYGFFNDDDDEPNRTMQAASSSGGASVGFDPINGLGANVKPYGAYKPRPIPTLLQSLFYISFGGTLYSILLYGRIVLPMPDLVSGSNVLKAMRNEAKHQYQQQQQQQQQQQTGLSGGNASKSSRSNRAQKDNNPSRSWLEHIRSIVLENRFHLYSQVTFGRILESILVCILIPRTKFTCRATGHCPNTCSKNDLAKILFHVGITTALRRDGAFDNSNNNSLSTASSVTPDRWSAIMALSSVIFITLSLLLCQAVTLSRSYLGIMGYLTGEWVVVDMEKDASILERAGRPSSWDPRRRYKKGDLVAESMAPNFGKVIVYKATSNNPEGRPFDLYLRASHDLFRNELGHPASSQVIAFLSTLQFTWILVLMLAILGYQVMGFDNSSLLWTFAANLVAVYGTIAVAMPPYKEMDQLARDLMKED